MALGESAVNGALWDTRRLPKRNLALPSMGALLGELDFPLHSQGNKIRNFAVNPELKDCSTGLCSEAPQEATEQDPYPSEAGGTPARWKEQLASYSEISENLVSSEKVSILGLQNRQKNRSGAAKRRARKARLPGILLAANFNRPRYTWASASGQSQSNPAGDQHVLEPHKRR